MLVTGIGGTGVVTIGALLGMAAHLEGKGCSVLDMTGLAQKNGAVVSHVRIGDSPEQMFATRIAAGEAKLVLACDILTGVGYEALAKMQKGTTKALVNTALVMPAQFTREPDLRFPTGSMEQEIKDAVGPGDAEFLDATRLATGLMGDSIATNLFMVGSPTTFRNSPASTLTPSGSASPPTTDSSTRWATSTSRSRSSPSPSR